MNEIFRQHVERLEPMFQTLLSMPAYKLTTLPRQMPSAGVYLLSEGDQHLYVGRSRNIRRRLSNHCSSDHRMAAFAFLLAREETGLLRATYTPEGSRAHLMTQPDFQAAFVRSSERIRNMDIRYVEESDPVRQALLEVYVAIALGTKFNKFETT
jgi:hypothetical protein